MASFTTLSIFLVLFSTFFVSKIADGNEQYTAQLTEASHSQTGWDGNQKPGATEVTPPPEEEAAVSEGDESSADVTEAAPPSPSLPPPPPEAAAAPCDITSISSKIETLERKVESLVSQLTANLEGKLTDLKSTVVTTTTVETPTANNNNHNSNGASSSASASSSPDGSSIKKQESFAGCVEALKVANIPEAMTQWDNVEKETFGPTAKAALLKDIFYLAYDGSRSSVVKFAQELINSSKKFLPSVFDVLKEATILNSGNIFSLATTIKNEVGVESSLFQKLPESVRSVSTGKLVKLAFLCKTSQKKLEMHVRDDEMTWEREYWPVVASHTYNLNHTKGAIWSFEANANGNFNVKNSWFGDYLWIEPNYQNLRTVDEQLKNRNGTEFKLSLNPDSSSVTLHSVFYKDAPVVEAYHSRNTRDASRPLRVDQDQTGIKFSVELATKAR